MADTIGRVGEGEEEEEEEEEEWEAEETTRVPRNFESRSSKNEDMSYTGPFIDTVLH